MKSLILATLVLALFAGPALAQAVPPADEQPPAEKPDEKPAEKPADQPPAVPAVPKGKDLVQITPKEGGWKIEELFRTIAEYTGESIVYDPAAPQIARKTIEFVGTQVVPKDQLFSWFQSLLSFQRIILVPVGPRDFEQWMALDLNATSITNRPIFVQEDEIENWADRDGVYIVTTITVKNMGDTSRARNALAQLSTRQIGRINDVPGNLSFVVADFAPVVASMFRLLRAMDKKPLEYTPVARTYQLHHAVALELEPILINLLQQRQTTNVPRGRNTGQGAPQKPEPQIISDTRQDAIIVFAVPEDQEKIAEIVALLDQKVEYKRGNIHYRSVKHTNAPELADILNQLIDGTGTTSSTRRPTPGRRPGMPGPASSGTLSGAQDDPVIVADDRTNGLLIQATATQMADLDDLIEQIDIPRDQVLVEAALVELSMDDLISFGMEMVSATNQGDPNERTFFGGTHFGLTEYHDTDGDFIPDINVPNLTNGITAGIFDNSRFPVVMQAISTTSQARALSIPSVVVEDGSQARMTVSDQVPYTVRSTTAGDTNFSVDFTDAEITLDISPHISSDNYLRLHIHQIVQSFRAQTNIELPPPRTSREIETDIVIPDGYTVVMGGLINEIETETQEGVPYLEDIPLLGYFFSSRSNAKTTQSLFLFVTPHILPHKKSNFTAYHAITWRRKLLADKLLDETISIHEARFKLDPAEQAREKHEADRIEESGFTDVPRYHDQVTPPPRPEDWRKRFDEVRAEEDPKSGEEDGQ